MIIVKMPDFGLGNQLFLYTYARYLCDRDNRRLAVYFPRRAQHGADYENGMKNLQVRIDRVLTFRELLLLAGGKLFCYTMLQLMDKVIRRSPNTHISLERRYGRLLSRKGIITNYDVSHWEGYFDDCPAGRSLIMGYFQVPFYAQEECKNLRKELTPRSPLPAAAAGFVRQMQESVSVCLHIRLGDYLGNPFHFVCGDGYYEKAVRKMEGLVRDPVFFLFTDGPDYVRERLKERGEGRFILVSGLLRESGTADYEELYLMAHCKHFIISNSSFSWWAQFLADTPGKKVIAPRAWYGDEKVQGRLFQQEWEYID